MSNYLGVDPGRSKTGLALVAADGKILSLHIAMTDNLAAELRQFVGSAKLSCRELLWATAQIIRL